MSPREVWITGMGIACPLGWDLDTVAEGQREARSGAVALADSFDTTGFPVLAACRVPNSDLDEPDLKAAFGIHAARAALQDAFGGVTISGDPTRVGLHLASGLVSTPVAEAEDELLSVMDPDGRYVHADAARRLAGPSPWRARHFTDRVNHEVARITGLRGPALVNHGACAASATAVGLGARWIERGRCDVVLAGRSMRVDAPML